MSSSANCNKCGERKPIGSKRQDPATYVCRPCRAIIRAQHEQWNCKHCGTAKASGVGNLCRPCTSRENRRESNRRRTRKHQNPCEACGKKINRKGAGHDKGRFCSQECYKSTRKLKVPQSRIYVRPCRWCNQLFTTGTRSVAYCSDYCRLSKTIGKSANRAKDLYSEACKLGFGGADWRKKLVAALRERDGNLCCLCWSPIDFTIKSGPRGSRNGHSIEHLTPRSQTQDDSWENLALSHWGCNFDRMTKPIDILWRAS